MKPAFGSIAGSSGIFRHLRMGNYKKCFAQDGSCRWQTGRGFPAVASWPEHSRAAARYRTAKAQLEQKTLRETASLRS